MGLGVGASDADAWEAAPAEVPASDRSASWYSPLCAPVVAAAQWAYRAGSTETRTPIYLTKENGLLQGLAFVLQPTCQTYLSSDDHRYTAG